MRVLLLILLLTFSQPAAGANKRTPTRPRRPLPVEIRSLLQRAPVARGAYWGIYIVDLESGRVLFEQNADRFFVPASNTKLFTTAFGLMRLGPDFRVETKVTARSAPDEAGRIHGDLVLVGAGDANLSGREIPYQSGSESGDPLAAIEDLASQVYARGVRRIDGNVVGDDSAFVWEPYVKGWSVDDPVTEDGAPVSALAVNDNTISLLISPGDHEGAPATLAFSPDLPVFEIENRVTTANTQTPKIKVDREPGSRQLRLYGTISSQEGAISMRVAVDDPARYAALALMDALRRRGVSIDGVAVALHLYRGAPPLPAMEAAVTLATRTSPPLLEDLRVIEKVSQNLHSEMMLRIAARQLSGTATREAGLEQERDFLDSAGIAGSDYTFHDGSGLSRLGLVTPRAIVELLRYMANSPQRENWMGLFPIAGVDGSLSSRFERSPARGHLRAKTGSLTHVSALSGYVERRGGSLVVFSILVNNFNGPSSDVRAIADKIGSLLRE